MNSIEREGTVYKIRFDYSPAIIADLRQLPGRRALPEQGVWTVPAIFGRNVADFAIKHGFPMDAIVQGEEAPAVIDFDGNHFLLTFDYTDLSLTASVATMRGSIWFQPLECWMVPADQGLAVNAWAETASADLTDPAEDAVAACVNFEENIIRSSAKNSTYTIEGMGYDLYDYQLAGVDYVINVAQGAAIIGDEPGVGKTLQALGVIHVLEAKPALIIVPASLKVNWRREVKNALPNVTVDILRGTRATPRLLWADVTIINYDILPAWESILPQFKAVLADESHKIKNPKIERTRATIRIMNAAEKVRLCLTGTAVLNKPTEILTQVEAIGKIDHLGGMKAARRTYKSRGTDLNRKLRSFCYIRRLKKDVWVDMPDRQWAPIIVEGDPKAMSEYQRAEADIVKFLAEKAEQAAIESGATTMEAKTEAWKAALKADAAKYLVAISQLKQLAAKAKLPTAQDWSRNFLESDEKLVIYGWHTAIVDSMATALNGVKVQGGQTEQARDNAVQLFQKNPKCRVLVGQIMAAGEGLTLTAASNALILEQGWTPGAMDQVLDRLHRRGQHNDVTGWLMLCEDTIDIKIHELLKQKRKVVYETLDGYDRSEDEGTGSVLQDLVLALAERGMEDG